MLHSSAHGTTQVSVGVSDILLLTPHSTPCLPAMFDPFSELKSSYQAVRKNSAANDVYNRLHSIAKDIEFVRRVSHEWYNDQLVVIRQYTWVYHCHPVS
jgi:hypothetical protein